MAKNLKPVGVVAEWLDLSERRVQQMAAEGILPRADRGQYDLQACVKAYIHFLKSIPGAGSSEDQRIDYGKERARLVKYKADLTEMEAAQAKGELLQAEDVKNTWIEMVSHCRARLLALPTKLAPIVYAQKTLPEITAAIKQGVHEALAELSRTEIETDHPDGENPGAENGGPGGPGGSSTTA